MPQINDNGAEAEEQLSGEPLEDAKAPKEEPGEPIREADFLEDDGSESVGPPPEGEKPDIGTPTEDQSLGGATIHASVPTATPISGRTAAGARTQTRAERDRKREKLMAAKSYIQQAIRNRNIISGPVSAVIDKRSGEDIMPCLAVNLPDSPVQFLIPYPRVFQSDPINSDSVNLETAAGKRDYLRRQTQILRKLIGLEITFIPLSLIDNDEDEITSVVASRTAALYRTRVRNYIGAAGRPPVIAKNNLYEATIISVGENIVLVELYGVETRIRKQYLTNRYIPNLMRKMQAGDKINVLVTEVERFNRQNAEGRNIPDVRVTMSAYQGEVEAHRENLKFLSIGSTVFARISKILPRGESDAAGFRYFGWVDGVDVPLIITNIPVTRAGRPLSVGDQVTVNITNVDVGGDGYARGYATTVHRTAASVDNE